MIAIFAAFKKELEPFLAKSVIKKNYKIGFGNIYLVESFGEERVLVLTGLGKTSAAMVTQFVLLKWKIDKLLIVGFAGGLNPVLKVSDIFMAKKVCFHDVDYSPFFEQEIYETSGNSEIEFLNIYYQYCEKKDVALCGTLATGDKVIRDNNERKKLFARGFDSCDMEAAAVLKVASFYKNKWFVIKQISDILN